MLVNDLKHEGFIESLSRQGPLAGLTLSFELSLKEGASSLWVLEGGVVFVFLDDILISQPKRNRNQGLE